MCLNSIRRREGYDNTGTAIFYRIFEVSKSGKWVHQTITAPFFISSNKLMLQGDNRLIAHSGIR